MIREVTACRAGDGHTQNLELSCGHLKNLTGAEIDMLADRAAKLGGGTLTTDCKLCDTISLPPKPEKFPKMRPIPITAAERIAKEYGYDQVVIYARRCHDTPEPHGEHMATYGRTKEHCSVAARIGDTLQRQMGWLTAKEQWVEREAIRRHAETDCTGRMWQDLSVEQQEELRAECRADWEAD